MKAVRKNGKLQIHANDKIFVFAKSIRDERAIALVKAGKAIGTEKQYETGLYVFIDDVEFVDVEATEADMKKFKVSDLTLILAELMK